MARQPHPARDHAISDIKNLVAFYGDQAEGERAARAKWADIPATTFAGWCALARRPAEPASVRLTSVRAPAADSKPMTFEERIAAMDRHVEMIIVASTREVVDEVTGEVIKTVARNPAMLAQAVRLQQSAAELLVRGSQLAWNLGRMEDMYDSVIAEIGKVSPEVQQAVLSRLRELSKSRDNPPFGGRPDLEF